MVGVEFRKPTLTGEVFHNDLHQRSIFFQQMRKGENGFVISLANWILRKDDNGLDPNTPV